MADNWQKRQGGGGAAHPTGMTRVWGARFTFGNAFLFEKKDIGETS